MVEKIKKKADSIFSEVLEIRRCLHQHPELSFKEYETSEYIKSILTRWGISFTENIAETGIVVFLHGNNPKSRIIALRADFDALPITEENEVDYCSVNLGVMHACGHDAHTASLLGVVKILDSLKGEWEGSIRCIFQPAEEQFPGGAQQMIKEGVLKNPQVEKMFAQHVFPEMEVGKIGFCPGQYMASADEIYITVKGKGGHAALPDKYNNPIVAAARLITNLEEYFLEYRDIPSVFALGFVEAKGHSNVIPENVEIKGTFRAMNEEFRSVSHDKMHEIVLAVAGEYSVDVNLKVFKGYPSLYNNVDLTKDAINIAKKYVGEENVIELETRMTAEDFSYYSHALPSCFYRLGTANLSKGIVHGLHTSRFNIDEEALKIGMGFMAYLAIQS